MIIHLGRGVAVHSDYVVAMTDVQHGLAPDVAKLLEQMRAQGVVRVLVPSPKTLVLCYDRRKKTPRTMCYLSGIGLRTLRLRADEIQRINNAHAVRKLTDKSFDTGLPQAD